MASKQQKDQFEEPSSSSPSQRIAEEQQHQQQQQQQQHRQRQEAPRSRGGPSAGYVSPYEGYNYEGPVVRGEEEYRQSLPRRIARGGWRDQPTFDRRDQPIYGRQSYGQEYGFRDAQQGYVTDVDKFFQPGHYTEERADGRADLPPTEVIVHPPSGMPPAMRSSVYITPPVSPVMRAAAYVAPPPPMQMERVVTRSAQVEVPSNVEIEYREYIRYPDGRVETSRPTFDYVDRNQFLATHPNITYNTEEDVASFNYGGAAFGSGWRQAGGGYSSYASSGLPSRSYFDGYQRNHHNLVMGGEPYMPSRQQYQPQQQQQQQSTQHSAAPAQQLSEESSKPSS